VQLAGTGAPAYGQAWAPPKGQGAVTFSFQRIDNTGHRLSDGFLLERFQSVNMSVYVEADYALTNRFSVSAGLPYVFTKFVDPDSTPPGVLPFLPKDQCRCWHSGPQDFGFTARYNVVRAASGTFSLTPSVSLGIPSHNYDFRGETSLGRNLKEATIAMDVGQRLDPISPDLSVQVRYAYAFVEPVLDVSLNRSNASVEANYLLLNRRLAARGFGIWQVTHGGLILGSPSNPGPLDFAGSPERLFQVDRLQRDNNFRAGGGISYAFPRMDVFVSYVVYVSGTSTHAGRAVTIGVSWPFQRSFRRP
jgi:hypothetical protein